MDRKRIIGEVAARHGVLLEEDDPAFLLVTIAEIALRDAQSRVFGCGAANASPTRRKPRNGCKRASGRRSATRFGGL